MISNTLTRQDLAWISSHEVLGARGVGCAGQDPDAAHPRGRRGGRAGRWLHRGDGAQVGRARGGAPRRAVECFQEVEMLSQTNFLVQDL